MERTLDRDEELPVEVLVGQLFVVQPDPALSRREALRAHEANYYGSFMVRPENLASIDETRALTRDMRAYWRRLPPPMVAVDEEGGLVSDTGHLTAGAPSPEALGLVDDIDLTRDVYESVGRKLMALGINTAFAPVLDVNSNPQNPVIGTRSFGSDPVLVAKHGLAAIEGLRAAHVAACVKHFPGHGDTREDSHNALPVVKADRDTLMQRELVPFIEAFDATDPPEMVMCAHVAYPGLGDSKKPATWSRAILRDLLRGELRYNGLVISDAMEMSAVGSLAPELAAFEAITAGVDLLLYAHDREMAGKAYRGLVDAVNSGRLPRDRVWESVERIFNLRGRFRGDRWMGEEEAQERLGVSEDQALYQAALKALVLEGNLGALGDLASALGRKTLVLPESVGERPIAVDVVREQLEPYGFRVETLPADPAKDQVDRLRAGLDPEGALVLATASRGPMSKAARRTVKKLTDGDMIKIGVALLDPGDADEMLSTNCRIKTFGTSRTQLWAMCQKLIP